MHDRKISPWWYWSNRFLRASPFTSAWHYCWQTPSGSYSGLASASKRPYLFRFLEQCFLLVYFSVLPRKKVWHSFKVIFPSECPDECGNVRPDPPLRLHQQQGEHIIHIPPLLATWILALISDHLCALTEAWRQFWGEGSRNSVRGLVPNPQSDQFKKNCYPIVHPRPLNWKVHPFYLLAYKIFNSRTNF